jgi:hypothetical protein
MSKVGKLGERIRSDYLVKDRYAEYKRLIEDSLAFGFQHWTITDLAVALRAGSLPCSSAILAQRHHIDTDVSGARTPRSGGTAACAPRIIFDSSASMICV